MEKIHFRTLVEDTENEKEIRVNSKLSIVAGM